MKKLLLAFFLLAGFFANAQDNTLGTEEETRDTLFYPEVNARLVIVPFEPKMYRSDVDREIGDHDGLSYQEIRGFFRLGLDNALYLEAKKDYDVLRLHDDDAELNKDLYYVYNSMGYQYREVPREDDKEKKKIVKAYNKVVDKLKKEEEETPGTRMDEGQIKSVPDKTEKFMARTIINPNVLDYLEEKHQAGLFLFINQFDIKHAPGLDWTDYSSDDYPREIKVHFSVYTKDEHEVYSGIAVNYFSSRTNSIKKIIKNHFPGLAAQVMEKVPVLVIQPREELLAE